jgi:hypothetical protein
MAQATRSDAASLVYINFTERAKVDVSLLLSFTAPGSANDPRIVAALQREVAAASYDAMRAAAGGVAPSNVTVIPTVAVNADGSIVVTMRVLAAFAESVNSTAFAAAAAFAADPAAATAAAVKTAANGTEFAQAAAGVALAAARAVAVADSFANGSLLTGSPAARLDARLAAALFAALVALGRGSDAALVNATLFKPSASAEAGALSSDITTISSAAGASGIGAAAAGGASTPYFNDSLISSLAFGAASFTALSLLIHQRRRAARAAVKKAPPSEFVNPMHSRGAAKPRPPVGRPPKSAFTPFSRA